MKSHFLTLGLATLLAIVLQPSNVRAAETLTPDSEGYIRHWLMLAPIALPENESCADALLKDQIRNEAALRPQPGQKSTVGGKELTWQPITAVTNFFDFNASLKSINDHAAGYMATYVECDAETPDVIVAVGSNDQGRIYFNGVDIYAHTEARPLMLDADRGKITLKKGINVIVFKVLNEQNSWQGSMRLLNKAGAPLPNVRIKLTP